MSDDILNSPGEPTEHTAALADLLLGPETAAPEAAPVDEPTEPAEASDEPAEEQTTAADTTETEQAPAEQTGPRWSVSRVESMRPEDWTPELLADAARWSGGRIAKAEQQLRKANQKARDLQTAQTTFVEARDSHTALMRDLRDKRLEPERRLAALARLAGDDQHVLWQELVFSMAGQDVPGAAKEGEKPLTKADVERMLAERKTAEQTQVQTLQQYRGALAQGIIDKENFPHLAAAAEEHGAETAISELLQFATERQNSGLSTVASDILALADRAIARNAGAKQKAPTVSGKSVPKSQAAPQRAARHVPARLADATTSATRTPTRTEHLASIADFLGK